jgi:glucose/arabinose dehydrogenase
MGETRMLLIRSITAAALMLTVSLLGAGQVPSAQVAGAGAPAAPQAPQGGRGGGRGGAGAMLYTELCATCHGSGAAPARAVNVFDDAWLSKRDDESLAKAIRDGVPGTDMNSLADKLDAQQIWQIVVYMRTRAAEIKGRPEYVPDPDGQIVKSEKQTFKIEVVARDLETPWALAFLPDGRLLVTERPGRLRVIEKGKLLPDPVKGTPKVWERQDGGMFDIELHPQYAKNGWIYLSYSETVPNYAPPPPAPAPDPAAAAPTGRGRGNQPPSIPSMTVIVRGKIKNNEWVEEQVLFRAAPELYTTNNSHYGSRFIFDRQNHLFWTLGERGAMADAQDLSKPTGKIHRVNDDGSAPKDNPFVGKAGAVPTIWTYGNRNPQGLAWDPVTGQLWESEHGPQGGDEINITACSRESRAARRTEWNRRSPTTRRRSRRAASPSTPARAIPDGGTVCS